MPDIGRPTTANPFRNIKKGRPQGARVPKEVANSDVKLEDSLNRAAGVAEETRFVDGKKHNQLGKEGFLKLLTHQLQNQDPLKPMDQKKFAADLAQFSQLEQLTQMNKKLAGGDEEKSVQNKYFGASFLGKEITTAGATLKYDGRSNRVIIPFELPQNAKNLIVRVLDGKGQVVRQLDFEESFRKGPQSVVWDGIRNDKARATSGDFTYSILAYDENFKSFSGKTSSKGLVTGVNFENGETVLTVDGNKKVFLRDVDRFNLPTGKNEPQNDAVLKKQAKSAYNKTGQPSQ